MNHVFSESIHFRSSAAASEAGWSEPKKARDTQSENLELLEASC